MTLNDTFHVPEDTFVKLTTGEYTRYGGIVRDTKTGQIVEHLKPIIDSTTNEKTSNSGIGYLIAGGILSLATIVGIAIYEIFKHKQPKVLKKFTEKLTIYTYLLENDTLKESDVDSMIRSLEELREWCRKKKREITLPIDVFEKLLTIMHDYTLKHASEKAVDLTEEEKNLPNTTILSFRKALETQKKLFKPAA